MGTGSFLFPAVLPTASSYTVLTDVPKVTGMQFLVSTTGCNLSGIKFYKDSGDTGSHVGTVYRVSDSANLGSVTFTGETSSGWQSMAIGPIALTNGESYRIAISHATKYITAPRPANIVDGPYTMSSTAYTGASGLPATTLANTMVLVDVVLDNWPTDARASQAIGETWVVDTPAVRASQVIAEAWIQQVPPTELRASQDMAEMWVDVTPPKVNFSVSQVLAEVWLGTPGLERRRVSAQVI